MRGEQSILSKGVETSRGHSINQGKSKEDYLLAVHSINTKSTRKIIFASGGLGLLRWVWTVTNGIGVREFKSYYKWYRS